MEEMMIRPSDRSLRSKYELMSLDYLMPQDHYLVAVDYYVMDQEIYQLLRPFYPEKGRLALNPSILFRIVLLMYLEEKRTLKEFLEDFSINVAYRWFLKMPFSMSLTKDQIMYNLQKHEQSPLQELLYQVIDELEMDGIIEPKIYFSASIKRLRRS